MPPLSQPIAIVAGARPNFMKVAPLCRVLAQRNIPHQLINTGQHFDEAMAGQFFAEFGLQPQVTLSPSRATVVQQFSDIMTGLEREWTRARPCYVVVVGDVNSTLAAALAANKLGIPVAHVEAGLRSYNERMPEETNRICTDRLSSLLLATDETALRNLQREGLEKRAQLTGNIMIDTVRMFADTIPKTEERFYFATLHRAENVDDAATFGDILAALEQIARDAKLYFSLHPRTAERAERFGYVERIHAAFSVVPPLSYAKSIFFQKHAQLVLTDSGGIQEETSFLGTPCLTLRTETERPITVTHGTNTIAGVSKASILQAYRQKDMQKKQTAIPLWDGQAAQRIVDALLAVIN